jgi:hypothetical protein
MDDPRLSQIISDWDSDLRHASEEDTEYVQSALSAIFDPTLDPVEHVLHMTGGRAANITSIKEFYNCVFRVSATILDLHEEKQVFKKLVNGLQKANRRTNQPMHVNLLEELCSKLLQADLRKLGDYLYAPVYMEDQFVNVYERSVAIKTWIYNACCDPDSDLLEGTMKNSTLINQFVNRIKIVTDARNIIRMHEPDNLLFSFRNGVVDIRTGLEFSPYNLGPFLKTSCMYHDLDYEDECGLTLDTPAIDTILHVQGITGKLYWLFFAFVFGRMLYEPSHDGWQKCVLIFGETGTGKSVSQWCPPPSTLESMRY